MNDLIFEQLDKYTLIAGWAVDFFKAAGERPWWAKFLLRIVLGKYAYREFLGLRDALNHGGLRTYYDYELKNMEYHNDPLPLKWWGESEPVPYISTEQPSDL